MALSIRRWVATVLLVQPLVRPAIVLLALMAVAALRWTIVIDGDAPALATGLGFGVALVAVAIVSGVTFGNARPVAIATGIVGGLVLVGLALTSRLAPGPTVPFAPASSFLPWAGVTVLVAFAEELVLRGALFDAIAAASGDLVAVVVTSVAFALIHVPLYGWHVVPLDLGVGLWLGGLRLVSGGVAAPAVAHAIADLATWWL
ncbi:MAG: CPBP family glutamic-type intramembrane protease [Candidatus Limnocylindrales bacterium]